MLAASARAGVGAAGLALVGCGDNDDGESSEGAGSASGRATGRRTAAAETATPIEHLVVLMQEHHTFDNYFGTGQTASRRTCAGLSIRTTRRAAISWSRSF